MKKKNAMHDQSVEKKALNEESVERSETTSDVQQETSNVKHDESKKKKNKKPQLPLDLTSVERFDVEINQGLNDQQVQSRIEAGLVNFDSSKKSKSIAKIIFSNIFTFFNIIYFVIAAILLYYCMPMQCTFLPVVFANTFIAIMQEIKAKKTLDKLNLITEPHVKVVRNGTEKEISIKDICLDDVFLLKVGEQISVDGVVLDGFVEVNESILTGESDAVLKKVGDKLYAGSYVVAGSCSAQACAVGKYNYIAGLTGKAKQYQKPRSQMLLSLKRILIFVAIIIVPTAVCLFIINATGNGVNWNNFSLFDRSDLIISNSIKSTAGSIISMIPAGPFLLTSVALGASFLRLSKNGTMAQELYCIEMLARVDTLCLDKTGTITDGTMRVVDAIDLRSGKPSYTIREIVSSMNSALKADNLTSKALKDYFGNPQNAVLASAAVVPFSSERKCSAVSFVGAGTYIIGAPEFVLKTDNQRVGEIVEKYAKEGLRVLLLTHSNGTINKGQLPNVRRPVAIIVIEDHIRPDAEETISWFKKNGVSIKIISGDNPITVSNIATRVGVDNASNFISLDGLTNEQVADAANKYTVFGRVSPEQKALLVRSMRKYGSTVAMTGDGVNDILAMKESDCSISLAGGSEAARKVSHLILLNDSFSALPKVVSEGRRVVNNIQSATSMYFMKTLYVIVLNFMLILLHFGWNQSFTTPLTNTRTLLLEWVIVALPTTILALQPNESLIKGKFLGNVLKKCLPASLTFVVTTASLYLLKFLTTPSIVSTPDELSTLVTITYTFGGLFALFVACKPFDVVWKKILYVAVWLIVLCGISIPQCRMIFEYVDLNREEILLLLVEILATPFLLHLFLYLFGLSKNVKLKK